MGSALACAPLRRHVGARQPVRLPDARSASPGTPSWPGFSSPVFPIRAPHSPANLSHLASLLEHHSVARSASLETGPPSFPLPMHCPQFSLLVQFGIPIFEIPLRRPAGSVWNSNLGRQIALTASDCGPRHRLAGVGPCDPDRSPVPLYRATTPGLAFLGRCDAQGGASPRLLRGLPPPFHVGPI